MRHLLRCSANGPHWRANGAEGVASRNQSIHMHHHPLLHSLPHCPSIVSIHLVQQIGQDQLGYILILSFVEVVHLCPTDCGVWALALHAIQGQLIQRVFIRMVAKVSQQPLSTCMPLVVSHLLMLDGSLHPCRLSSYRPPCCPCTPIVE